MSEKYEYEYENFDLMKNKIYDKPYNPDEYEENQFNEFLKDLMLAESNIEKIKINLAKMPDFNIEDCFRLFENINLDKINGDILYPEEIQCGFKKLNLFASDFEIKLFFKRFMNNNKCDDNAYFINFANFFDIFTPFTKIYREMIEKKEPNFCYNDYYDCCGQNGFSNETLSLMRNLVENIIKYETKFNFMRRGFSTLNLKLKKIFGKIDTGKNGYFSHDDLVIYMTKNRVFTNQKDLDLLFIRLDKNRNGKIDFSEIYNETHPLYF